MTDAGYHERIRRAFLGMDMTWIAGVGAIVLVVVGLFAYQYVHVASSVIDPTTSVFKVAEDAPFRTWPDEAAIATVMAPFQDIDATCHVAGWVDKIQSMVLVWCPSVSDGFVDSMATDLAHGDIPLIEIAGRAGIDGYVAPENPSRMTSSIFNLASGRAKVRSFVANQLACKDFAHAVRIRGELDRSYAVAGQICLHKVFDGWGMTARRALSMVHVDGWDDGFALTK